MTNPTDGRITSLSALPAALTSTDLFMVVQPGNASSGINYQATALQIANFAGSTFLPLAAVDGGTGQTTFVAGDILYASNATTLTKLAAATANYALNSQGPGMAVVWMKSREALVADRTYYINSTSGSDLNSGLTSTSALQTLNGVRPLIANLDLNSYTVAVQLADGTYTALAYTSAFMPVGSGNITFQGNSTTPANVLVLGPSAFNFQGGPNNQIFTVKDLAIRSSTSGNGILFNSVAGRWGNLSIGTCAVSQLLCFGGSQVICNGNYEITGGAQAHLLVRDPGTNCNNDGRTITLTGTPNFSVAFTQVFNLCYLEMALNTYIGSATGQRFNVSLNAVMATLGATTTLPGNANGSTATGGLFS